MENSEWKEAMSKIKPKNNIKFYDRKRGQMTINDKLLNDLKEKVDKNVQSIHKRNALLEATKRKNIFMNMIDLVELLIQY